MDQNKINQEEWNNPKNWSLLAYHSKRDSRMLVPKRWGFGWTVNFGNKKGAWLFVALMAIALTGLIVALIAGAAVHGHGK